MMRCDRHLVKGHADDRQGEDRPAAHCIDVRERVGGGNAAEVGGVVDDGRKEIGGGDDRLLVVQAVHRGVVARFDADQQIPGQPADRRLGEDLRQDRRRDLAAAAAAVGELRETDQIGRSVHGIKSGK
jgi:hypothetical protein